MPVRPLPSLRLSIQSRCTAAAVAAVHLQTYRYCTATILSRSWPSAQCRWSSHSHSPTSPTAKPSRKKVTINTLRNLYTNKTPIAVVTAHDFPSGLIADLAGVDVVLVGDSLAMVALGMEGTNQLTLEFSRKCSTTVGPCHAVSNLPFWWETSPWALMKFHRSTQSSRRSV